MVPLLGIASGLTGEFTVVGADLPPVRFPTIFCRRNTTGELSVILSTSLRKNLETDPMFSQVMVDFWRWIELWSLRSAVDYAATSLGMRIRL